jgi:hypothetical protein
VGLAALFFSIGFSAGFASAVVFALAILFPLPRGAVQQQMKLRVIPIEG